MIETDLCIVGAGIAGVSLAAQMASDRRVLLVEQEAHAGYHATGRSVAIFTHALPGALVAPLTRASAAFFNRADHAFATAPLRRARPVLQFGREEHSDALSALLESLLSAGGRARMCKGAEIQGIVPILRAEQASIAVIDDDAFEVDVDALLQAWLRQARAAGARLLPSSPVLSAERNRDGWLIHAGDQEISAQMLVNAAGAWGDEVARGAGLSPLGLAPRRRTVAVLPADGLELEHWPMCVAADHDLYFKPDAGRLLVSGMEEILSPPCDALVDDLDIAVAFERLEGVTGIAPRRPLSAWAGLRTFAPDDEPVAGFDRKDSAFFWLVGQGGAGIQTAPALAMAAAALLRGQAMPDALQECGVLAQNLSPTRFSSLD